MNNFNLKFLATRVVENQLQLTRTIKKNDNDDVIENVNSDC